MPLAIPASRHTVGSSLVSKGGGVWITDDLLQQAFERFTAVVLSSPSRKARNGGEFRSKRYGSNVPGPLESNRRLARRRLNCVSVGRPPSESLPPPISASMFGMPNGLFTEPYLPPEWTWQPPGSRPPERRPTLPLPPWLLLPKEPLSNHAPSYPALDLQELIRQPTKKTRKISVSQYSARLLEVDSLGQLRKLHADLGNATLEASFCSSIAFDHLLAINRHSYFSPVVPNDSVRNVSVADLLEFVQDGKLEHTSGSNLAKLAAHMTEDNSSQSEQRTLLKLIESHLNISSLCSAQALAGLYRSGPRLAQIAHDSGIDSQAALDSTILANFSYQIEQQSEVLPPTTSDLISLDHITSALTDARVRAKSILYTLERIIYGLRTGNINASELPEILKLLSASAKSAKKCLGDGLLLSRLIDVWCMEELSAITPQTHVLLAGTVLRLVNLLPLTKSCISFSYDLIREHASHSDISLLDMRRPEMRLALGICVQRFLRYEKWLSGKDQTPASGSSEASQACTGQSGPAKVTGESFLLTELLMSLPSSYAEQWVVQTPEALLRDLSSANKSSVMQTLNAWLSSVYRCDSHSWADRKNFKHPVWSSVLKQLSKHFRPPELLAPFHRINGYRVCCILLDNWIRQDIEREVAAMDDKAYHQRHDSDLQLLPLSPDADERGSRLVKLQARFIDVTLSSLECSFDFWTVKRLDKTLGLPDASRAYLGLLTALRPFGLQLDALVQSLLELSYETERPGVFDGVFHFSRQELGFRVTPKTRNILEAYIAKFGAMNPGRALGIFNSSPGLTVTRNPSLVPILISGRKSEVHPDYILRLLWANQHDIRLKAGHPDRVRPDCPLTRARIDLVHDAALEFATSDRLSPYNALRCVLHCLRYLHYQKAPLDARASRAVVVACLLRRLNEPNIKRLPPNWLDFCVKMVERIEGNAVASAVGRLTKDWDKYVATGTDDDHWHKAGIPQRL